MVFDKFSEALGVWVLPKDDDEEESIELKLKLGDGKKLRNILMKKGILNDKQRLFDLFDEFMFNLIKRDYPDVPDIKIRAYIELNILKLFEDAQLTFRFTTKDDVENAKKNINLKNVIENV